MNNGFYGFPSPTDSNIINAREFDTSGTYSIPQNAKRLFIFAVGGGGGGAGGTRRDAASGSPGGNGGAAGTYVLTELPVSAFKGISTLQIVIGAGGNGGIAGTTNGASPAAATSGGATQIWIPGQASYFISAGGNLFGNGGVGTGVSSNPNSGSSTGVSLLFGQPVKPMDVSLTGNPTLIDVTSLNKVGGGVGAGARGGSTGGNIFVFSPYECGGAGGGSLNSATVANGGGSVAIYQPNSVNTVHGGAAFSTSFMLFGNYAPGTTIYQGVCGNGQADAPNSYQMIAPNLMFSSGFGGAGGGAGATGAGRRATNGGNGYRGGGGGGGGGSCPGVTAGNGGAGGNGYVKIVAIG